MIENTISIPLDSSFSFSECLWFLDRNYDDCSHSIKDNQILKAVRINEQQFLLKVQQNADALEINIIGNERPENDSVIYDYVMEWLDLQRDLNPFYQILGTFPQLSYMADSFAGLRIIGIPDLFEALCWSIIGQQINLTFAYKLKRRLVEKYGTGIVYQDEVFPVFPVPEVLADADIADLRVMQFSTKKAEYIIGIAKAFTDGKISKKILTALPDLEARQRMLISFKGIGVWTANYALMKSLKEQSSIPYGDSGLLQALIIHKLITDRKDTIQIQDFFRKIEGWESYMVFYLWRSLSKN